MSSSKKRHRSSLPPKKSDGGRRVAAAGGTTRRRSTTSFPYKLYQLLEDISSGRKVCAMSRKKPPCPGADALKPCVAWSDEFDGSFLVYDSEVFMEEVACDYFKMTKYRSFTRQLNIWGYRHVIRRGYDEWHHPALVRGNPSSCDLISRTNATDTLNSRSKQPPAADGLIARRTMPVYPPVRASLGSTEAFAAVSSAAVKSSPGGPSPASAWDASGGMSSQCVAIAADGVSSMTPGMSPSFLSHTEMSGGIGSGGYDQFGFQGTLALLQQARAANATAERIVSAYAACGPSPVRSAPGPVPAERDDVTGNLFFPVVGEHPIDPFDDISIDDPSTPPAFDPDMYEGQLLGEFLPREDEGRTPSPPPSSSAASKRRRSTEPNENSNDPGKLVELRSSFLEASDPLVRRATLPPVGNGNPHSLSCPSAPTSGASTATASGLARATSVPDIPSNAVFNRSDYLLFLDSMIDIVPAAAATEVSTVPAESKVPVLAHFDHAARRASG